MPHGLFWDAVEVQYKTGSWRGFLWFFFAFRIDIIDTFYFCGLRLDRLYSRLESDNPFDDCFSHRGLIIVFNYDYIFVRIACNILRYFFLRLWEFFFENSQLFVQYKLFFRVTTEEVETTELIFWRFFCFALYGVLLCCVCVVTAKTSNFDSHDSLNWKRRFSKIFKTVWPEQIGRFINLIFY